MKIGFDVRPLQTAHRGSGIGTYTFNLLKHLLALPGQDEWVCYTLRGSRQDVGIDLPVQFPVHRPASQAHIGLWEQLLLPIDILRGRVNLFHATGGLTQVWEICAPRIQPVRTVITVQDLHPLILPHFNFIGSSRSFKWQMEAIRKAARLIAVSENTKQDIVRIVQVPPENIEVIHMAPGEHFQVLDAAEVQVCLEKYRIEPPFVLYVGNYSIHKNFEAILEAWHLIHPVVPLVIVGKRESYPPNLLDRAAELGRSDAVHIIGGLSYGSPDLVALYNAATVFVFPSLYEGFGLPVVEAMRCGCPVIASRRGSLPEVVGEGGRLVEPDDISGLAEEMQRIIDDDQWRETLREKGFENAGRFSWQHTAEKTLALYHEVASA